MKKIACLAICKNEEDNVTDFVKNLNTFNISKIFVLDTGSTDKTVSLFENFPNVILKSKKFDPFHFSNARNYLRDLVPHEFDYYLHLDLDERLESLPDLNIDEKKIILGRRNEVLFNTFTDNYLKLTPSLDYEYRFPIHETLVPRIANYKLDTNFVIRHVQKETKDRYESMTAHYFEQWPEHLFYHYIEDLYRLKQHDRLIQVFLKYVETPCFTKLSDQQSWYVVRNYQLALLQTHQKPDPRYLNLFETFKSSSSCYYLTLFHFHLNNLQRAKAYYQEGFQVVDSTLNKKFYNTKIKDYVEETVLNRLQNLT